MVSSDQCGKLCVVPLSSQGGTWGCHYFENQLFRNTFLFRHNHPLRPSWSSSPWEPFRRHFSSRGPLKRGCRRNCISTQWVPQCCKNHYGRDCQGKAACMDPWWLRGRAAQAESTIRDGDLW